MFLKNLNLERASLGFAALIFIGAQIQVLLGQNADYMGLRITLSDLFLPLAGLFVLYTLIKKQSIFPKWRAPFFTATIILASASIILGLLTAYLNYGEISNWALLNRGLGWFILVSYCYLGGWLTQNVSDETCEKAIKIFALFFFLSTIFFLAKFFIFELNKSFMDVGKENYDALSGFMGNRNAYAFLFVSVLALCSVFKSHNNRFLSDGVFAFFWLCVPFIAIFNGSRAGWILLVLTVIIGIFYLKRKSLKLIILPIILSTVVLTGFYQVNKNIILRENQIRRTQHAFEWVGSDQLRLRVVDDALALWRESKITGTGLGGFLIEQEEKYSGKARRYGKAFDQIDNSALWILTEMGMLGALAFGGLFISIAVGLRRTRSALTDSLFIILVFFALYSQVHHILYARYLWLLLGLGLGGAFLKKSETSPRASA